MKNKLVGALVLSIAALMGFVIWSFNSAMKSLVSESCTHGQSCPMWGHINFQTNVSIGIMLFVIFIGIYLVFFGEEVKIITKTKFVRKKEKNKSDTNYSKIKTLLDDEEKKIFEKIEKANGAVFQSSLVDEFDFGKVKVSRILDKLEGKGLVERRRRGMTNIVILKSKNQ